MRCAFVLTGGVAKGAFHAGILKSFAEAQIIPSVIVGSSAGSLNGALCSKLIATNSFTPENIEEQLIRVWVHEASLKTLWGDGQVDDHSLRSVIGGGRPNIFMLRRAANILARGSLTRLRNLISLQFTSVFSDQPFKELIARLLTTQERIEREVIFSAAVTDLTGDVVVYDFQAIINHGGYVTFSFRPSLSRSEIYEIYTKMRRVIQASSCFPGMFPPVPVEVEGKLQYLVDGGLTKNAPFGRAIKLDPEATTIFLMSSMPITKPAFEKIDDLMTMVGQVYKIILNKDLANDYRKIYQINNRIEKVRQLLKRDDQGAFIKDSEFNQAVLRAAGYKDLDDFLSKRVVKIVVIEPDVVLEGDPFAGLYRQDRVRLMREYVDLGYQKANKVLKAYMKAKS